MKDIQTPLRELFFDLLAAQTITMYENGSIPDDAATPYAIISSMTSQENSNKTGFGNNVQTLFDIVAKYPRNSFIGSKEVDTIAGYLLASINSKVKLNIGGFLQIVNTKILQDEKISTNNTTSVVHRRLIRIEQLIMEV